MTNLCDMHSATMEANPTKGCNQDDATGFVRLNVLRLKVTAKVKRKKWRQRGVVIFSQHERRRKNQSRCSQA